MENFKIFVFQVRDFATKALHELEGMNYDLDGIEKLQVLTSQMNLEEGSASLFSTMFEKTKERKHRLQPKGKYKT